MQRAWQPKNYQAHFNIKILFLNTKVARHSVIITSTILRAPLLVFDGESFWHVLHGTLPRMFGGQFIQFRKKAEDFCKRLIQMGFRLAFVFGNSPISAEAKVS
jgi:hypothetical protein